MRKKLFTAILSSCFLMMYSCSTEPSVPKGEYLIQGKLLNVPDGVEIRLYAQDGYFLKEVAQDTLIDGEFMFRDTITTGIRRLRLNVLTEGFGRTQRSIWVASGELIKVTGEDSLIKTWNVESNLPEQKEENSFDKTSIPEHKEELRLQARINDLRKIIYSKNSSSELTAKCWIESDSLRKFEKPLRDATIKKELSYLKKAPISIVWMYHFFNYATILQHERNSPHVPKIKELYARMSDSDKQTELGKLITSYMNLPEEVNVGDYMVDGDLYDLEGKVRNLSEFKGKYIMLIFWSFGYSPCIQSIPELEEISEMYKDKLAVVSINMDSKKSWQEYIAEKKTTGFQWNELREGWTGLAASYQVKSIPHYVLISPDGKVQDIWGGYGKGSLKTKLKDL